MIVWWCEGKIVPLHHQTLKTQMAMTKLQREYEEKKKELQGKINELQAVIMAQPNREYNLAGKGIVVDFGLSWIEMCEVKRLVFIGDKPSVCNYINHAFYLSLCPPRKIEAIYNAIMDDLEE
jgi:hypothetical protein